MYWERWHTTVCVEVTHELLGAGFLLLHVSSGDQTQGIRLGDNPFACPAISRALPSLQPCVFGVMAFYSPLQVFFFNPALFFINTFPLMVSRQSA